MHRVDDRPVEVQLTVAIQLAEDGLVEAFPQPGPGPFGEPAVRGGPGRAEVVLRIAVGG
jgi:hypothetical protein